MYKIRYTWKIQDFLSKLEMLRRNHSAEFYTLVTYKLFFCFLHKESFSIVTQFHMKINCFSINFNINL